MPLRRPLPHRIDLGSGEVNGQPIFGRGVAEVEAALGHPDRVQTTSISNGHREPTLYYGGTRPGDAALLVRFGWRQHRLRAISLYYQSRASSIPGSVTCCACSRSSCSARSSRRTLPATTWPSAAAPSRAGSAAAAASKPRAEPSSSPSASTRTGRPAPSSSSRTATTLLQGLLVCRECGYACYRTSTRTTKGRIYYYRCISSDNYRFAGGRVCRSRPIRQDELDALWAGSGDFSPSRRSSARRSRAGSRRCTRSIRQASAGTASRASFSACGAGVARLLDAYQESLVSLAELRAHARAAQA